MELFIIFFSSIFVNNLALTYFLGMCPFISVSNDLKTAFGMGIAVTFVITITAGINWLVYNYILIPFGVEYLQYVSFIIVIAATVQVVELVIERSSPVLYINMGVFLPLITVNCAILGLSLFMVVRDYTFVQSMVFGFGGGLGWLVAIMAMAGIRTRLRFSNVPEALKGPGITMMITGIMALGFMGFAGMAGG
ncbi:MAG: electron transport complex protein RnfA [Candidatus Anammoxibacter sp.]